MFKKRVTENELNVYKKSISGEIDLPYLSGLSPLWYPRTIYIYNKETVELFVIVAL